MVTKEIFERDVASHQLTILRDEGVYRHIRFSKPGTNILRFDLITWPGHLCYTGDMGTYVFERLEDMFRFFGPDKGRLSINPGYWGEKCIAVDSCDGIREYDPEKFRAVVNDWRASILEDKADDLKFSVQFNEAVDEELLCHVDSSSEHEARTALSEFEFEYEGKAYTCRDSWEWTLTSKTNRFIWCCYAIAWGIDQYNKEHGNVRQETKQEAVS